MSTITKINMVRAVAQKTGMSHRMSKNAIETFLSEIQIAVASGNRVEFRGFGTWEVKMGKARIGRNPSNPAAEPIQIPARPVLRFKTGKGLKVALRSIMET